MHDRHLPTVSHVDCEWAKWPSLIEFPYVLNSHDANQYSESMTKDKLARQWKLMLANDTTELVSFSKLWS
jgi:hypothetical protein